jgi:hypothetical protein
VGTLNGRLWQCGLDPSRSLRKCRCDFGMACRPRSRGSGAGYYAQFALSKNTSGNYTSQAMGYVMFALAYGYQPIFPASDAALRAYLAFKSISCSPQSLRTYLSGLRQAHLDKGFEWVTASARHFVWKTYCGIKRMHGRPTKPKLAVTLRLLHEFARQILAN